MAFFVETEADASSANKETVELQFGNVDKEMKIPLEYDSHRGNYFNLDDTHPIKLLDETKKLYCSSKCSSFDQKENDWIIFKFQKNNRKTFIPIPTRMEVKNGSCKSAAKVMRIYIGNRENKEWYRLTNDDIILEKQEDKCQSFDISEVIKFNDLQHIKLEFIENYGEQWEIGAKFCVFEFHLYGYIA